MKKFIAPEINSVEINSEDVIMASTIAMENTGISYDNPGFTDGASGATGIWMGADDSWN